MKRGFKINADQNASRNIRDRALTALGLMSEGRRNPPSGSERTLRNQDSATGLTSASEYGSDGNSTEAPAACRGVVHEIKITIGYKKSAPS
jgi:hypothetical protein